MSTFVTVGNTIHPFGRLLAAVEDLARRQLLPQPITVQHGNTPFNSKHCQTAKFLSLTAFMRHLADADLIICHGGAGTLIQTLQLHKLPVVVARSAQYQEMIDDHQSQLVRALAEAKRIITATPSDLLDGIRAWRAATGSPPGPPTMGPLVRMIADELERQATTVAESGNS